MHHPTHLLVQPSGAAEGRVDAVGAVGGPDDQDAGVVPRISLRAGGVVEQEPQLRDEARGGGGLRGL